MIEISSINLLECYGGIGHVEEASIGLRLKELDDSVIVQDQLSRVAASDVNSTSGIERSTSLNN